MRGISVHRRPAKAGLALVLAGLCLTAACSAKADGTPPPAESSTPPLVKGPLLSLGSMTLNNNRPPAGKLMDEGWIPLLNTGSKPVVLGRVRLIRRTGASPLRFAGAFVAPVSPGLHDAVAGKWGSPLVPVHGYRLLPSHGSNKVPVLVLRVGPSGAAAAGGFRFSQNQEVRLYYRTSDGRRHVVVYLVQIQYPNR